MPNTPGGLPYPSYLGPADGPDAIHELALALDTQLAGKATAGHSHAIGTLPMGTSGSQVAYGDHVHAALSNTKLHARKLVVHTDAYGEVTFAHGAPFTPVGAVFAAFTGETSSDILVVTPIAFTATNARVRLAWVRANILFVNGNVNLAVVLF